MGFFAEIVFETGNKSVAYYEDEAEMESALKAHHQRAINGEPGSAADQRLRSDVPSQETRIGSWVAERVKRVFIYDDHPATFGEDQLVDAKELKATVDAAIKDSEMNGVVHVHTIAAKVRDMSSPLVAEPSAHESQYKAEERREADMAFLKAVE